MEHSVKVIHRLAILLLLIVHDGAVEVGEGVGGIEFNGLVHISYGQIIILLSSIQTTTSNIALRIETVQVDCLVVVIDSLQCIPQEEITGTSIEICRRILRLFADISVEV